MRLLALSDLPSLTHGQTLYHYKLKNADETPLRVRISGKVRTWKRNPERIEIPTKHGLYTHHIIGYDEIINGHWYIED